VVEAGLERPQKKTKQDDITDDAKDDCVYLRKLTIEDVEVAEVMSDCKLESRTEGGGDGVGAGGRESHASGEGLGLIL